MMPDLRIQVVRVGTVEVPLPRYQTDGAAGMDLHAALAEPVTLAPLARTRIPTGLVFAIPARFEGQDPAAVRARRAHRRHRAQLAGHD